LPGKIQPHKYRIGDTYADSALIDAVAASIKARALALRAVS